jgi:hypothetical protein
LRGVTGKYFVDCKVKFPLANLSNTEMIIIISGIRNFKCSQRQGPGVEALGQMHLVCEVIIINMRSILFFKFSGEFIKA